MPDEPVDVVRLRDGAIWVNCEHAPDRVCRACRWTAERQTLAPRLERLEAKLDALETLVREIRHALSAGAVGKWGNG